MFDSAIRIRVTYQLKTDMQNLAQKKGINLSELIREGINSIIKEQKQNQ